MTWPKLRLRLLLTLIPLALTALLLIWARGNPAGAAGYASVSRAFSAFLAGVFSVFPFSVAEFLLYGLVLFSLFTLFRSIFRSIRAKKALSFLSWLTRAAFVSAVLVFVFFALWGVGYFASPLTERLDLPDTALNTDSLYATTLWLAEETNAAAPYVPRDENGVADAGGYSVLARQANAGFAVLAEESSVFTTPSAPPKAFVFSDFLSLSGLSGIYIPFTGEALINANAIDAQLPFSLCHELSHRIGFCPEDEANFTAFLACRENPNPAFVYSGYHVALIYCLNALTEADTPRAREIWDMLDARVLADFSAQSDLLRQYDGPIRDIARDVNNGYLRTMAQEDGVKSYGRVVDLLIALHEMEQS